jgi:integral membrane protein
MTDSSEAVADDAAEAERRRKLHAAFTRYRVMAFVVGTMLLAVFLFLILRRAFGLHVETAEKIVDPLHGYLYLAYLVVAADLAVRARWRLGRILAVVAAGFVPFLAFYVEHRINVQMHAEDPAFGATPPTGDA